MKPISALAFTIVIFLSSCDKKSADHSIFEISFRMQSLSGGREIRWHAGSTEEGVPRVMVIDYVSTWNPERRIIRPGKHIVPFSELRGDAEVYQTYSQEIPGTGLKIDGDDLKLQPGLNIVFCSDILAPQRINIPPDKVDVFMSRAATLDLDSFLKDEVIPILESWPDIPPRSEQDAADQEPARRESNA